MNIPNEWVEKAAEVLCRGTDYRQCINYDPEVTTGCTKCEDESRLALNAVLPDILEAIAQEIENRVKLVTDSADEPLNGFIQGQVDGALAAARIVRNFGVDNG